MKKRKPLYDFCPKCKKAKCTCPKEDVERLDANTLLWTPGRKAAAQRTAGGFEEWWKGVQAEYGTPYSEKLIAGNAWNAGAAAMARVVGQPSKQEFVHTDQTFEEWWKKEASPGIKYSSGMKEIARAAWNARGGIR